jgi:hypothetical protein
MTSDFALLLDNKKIPNRWYLKAPLAADGTHLDPRTFIEGRPIATPTPLRIPLRREGQALDFTFAELTFK